MKALQIALTVIRLLPVIVNALHTVEVAFPFGKAGTAKFAAVLGIVEHAYESVGTIGGTATALIPWDQIAPAVGKTVNQIVGAFNASGWPSEAPVVPPILASAVSQ